MVDARESALPPDVRAEYPFTGKLLDVSGGKLHYLDEGAGETLLFVHGNPTWSFYWRKLIKPLSARYRCVAPDHIGCGLSDKPQDWSYRLEDHVANLSKLIESLDLRDVTLVIHDWGGPIGFGAALRHPDRIKRIVIFNSGCFEGPIPLEIRMCRWPVVGPVAIRGLNGFVRVGLLRATGDRRRFKGAVGRGYLAPYDSWAHRVANHRFIQDIPLEPHHPTRRYFLSIGEDLRRFADTPSMIVWGEKDFCFVPEYRAGFLARLPKSEVHVFQDAGHWVVEDAHERILPLMTAFLDKNPIPAPA